MTRARRDFADDRRVTVGVTPRSSRIGARKLYEMVREIADGDVYTGAAIENGVESIL